jgi:hypothetical protein
MAPTARRAPIARVAFALCALALPAAGANYYSVTSGGAQLDFGDAPRPLSGSGGLFKIPPNPNPAKALVKQTAGADPKQITIPPGVLVRKAPGKKFLGVAKRNNRIFQVRTNATFSVPAATAILKAGGRTGAATTTFTGPGSTSIRYAKKAAQFGGPAQIKALAVTPTRIWARGPSAAVPCKHPTFGGVDSGCIAVLLASHRGTLAAPGAKVGFVTTTPGGPAVMSPGSVLVSVPAATGLVAKSSPLPIGGKTAQFTNMVTSSGFPWTTGMLTISAPTAVGGKELLTLTGMDSRINGVGTLSLVSGALSTRTRTGANANRGWLQINLPEPPAAIGAAAALGALVLIHSLVARRTRAPRGRSSD